MNESLQLRLRSGYDYGFGLMIGLKKTQDYAEMSGYGDREDGYGYDTA